MEVTLNWNDATEDWRATVNPNPCAASCSGSGFDDTIAFRLECDTETKTAHRLYIDLDELDLYSDVMTAESTSDCNPLSLVFSYRDGGNVACEEDEDNSTMWFEVVEP
jgi:hypothetical protein